MMGRNKSGDWDEDTQTTTYNMGNQQTPTEGALLNIL